MIALTVPLGFWAEASVINIYPPDMEAVAGPEDEVEVPTPGLPQLQPIYTPSSPYSPRVNIVPPLLDSPPSVSPPQGTAPAIVAPAPPPAAPGLDGLVNAPWSSPSSSGQIRINITPPSGNWQENPTSTYNTTNFCGGAFEEEIVNATCPSRPPWYSDGVRRECSQRNLTNLEGAYGEDYADMIREHVTAASDSSGISPALIMALLDNESSFNPMAYGGDGEPGIAQFLPSTARATLNYWRSTGSSMIPILPGELQVYPPSDKCTVGRSTAACRAALLEESVCGSVQTGLRPNLYCPQFGIYLMAWHLKKTSVGVWNREVLGQQVDMASALQGDGDPVAQVRFLASVYNRGCRIFRSFADYAAAHGEIVSARNYGALWASEGTSAGRSSGCTEPLRGQFHNRCYIWRTTGICGGFGDSLVGQYLRQDFCSAGAGTGSGSTPAGGVQ